MPRAPRDRSSRRRSLVFLGRFVALLAVFTGIIALRAVDRTVVGPFTGAIARVSGTLLNALGEPVSVEATRIHARTFSVEIENGCNGLETVLLFVSAVLAFPAPWRRRATGVILGFAAIELFNLFRVASLVWIGEHHPALFSASHTILWQSLVVLFGVLLFLFWASRAGAEARGPGAAAPPR